MERVCFKFPFYNVGKLNVRILPKNTRSNLVQMKDEKLEMNHKICWRCVHFLTERRQEKKESYIRIKRGQVTDLQKKCDFSKVLLCVITFPRLSRNRTAACGASVIMRENGKAWSRQISELTTFRTQPWRSSLGFLLWAHLRQWKWLRSVIRWRDCHFNLPKNQNASIFQERFSGVLHVSQEDC